jgi:hypothetical protein
MDFAWLHDPQNSMAEGLKAQEQDRAINELSFLERLSLPIDLREEGMNQSQFR